MNWTPSDSECEELDWEEEVSFEHKKLFPSENYLLVCFIVVPLLFCHFFFLDLIFIILLATAY